MLKSDLRSRLCIPVGNISLVMGFLDLSTSMTLNELNPKRSGFADFFSQFLAAGHILTVNCDEMALDKSRQPAHEIFGIKRKFQRFES